MFELVIELTPKLNIISQNPDSKESTDFLITKIILELHRFGNLISFGISS